MKHIPVSAQTHTSQGVQRLAQALQQAVQSVTMTSPMPIDDIIGTLGFVLGCAIASSPDPRPQYQPRELRNLALANLDHGLQQGMASRTANAGSGIILPPGFKGN